MIIKHISISRDTTHIVDFRYYTEDDSGETKEVRVSNITPEIEASVLDLYTALEKDQSVTESYELLDSKMKELNEIQELMTKASSAVEQLLFENELTPEQRNQLISKYALWEQGKHYMVGYIVNYNGILYKILQTHNSQGDWNPESTPALYSPINPQTVIGEWKPYVGVVVYQIGSKVIYNGVVYESIAKDNVWKPDEHGWKKV